MVFFSKKYIIDFHINNKYFLKYIFASFIVLLFIGGNSVQAGDKEKEIIGKCAAFSGGEPSVFAACAFRDLSINQIKKCVGGDGCFGPNNELVRFTEWLTGNLWGNCKFASAGSTKSIAVLNNTSVAITYDTESSRTDWTTYTLQPGESHTITYHICDEWANINGPGGENYGYKMGDVVMFDWGTDDMAHQYILTPAK